MQATKFISQITHTTLRRQRPSAWVAQRAFSDVATNTPKITMVRKKLSDGRVDAESEAVMKTMESDGSLDKINSFEYADVNNLRTRGWDLAARHKVDTAPFFVVEDGTNTKIFTIYQNLKKEIL